MPDPISFESYYHGSRKPQGLKGGSGDGTFDDMDARVAVLEAGFKRMEATLDRIDARLLNVATDVTEIKATLPSLAKGVEVAEMKGALPALAKSDDVTAISASLKDKPSTWQAVIISVLISGLTVAAALGGAAKLLAK